MMYSSAHSAPSGSRIMPDSNIGETARALASLSDPAGEIGNRGIPAVHRSEMIAVPLLESSTRTAVGFLSQEDALGIAKKFADQMTEILRKRNGERAVDRKPPISLDQLPGILTP